MSASPPEVRALVVELASALASKDRLLNELRNAEQARREKGVLLFPRRNPPRIEP